MDADTLFDHDWDDGLYHHIDIEWDKTIAREDVIKWGSLYRHVHLLTMEP